ncbi:MAG: ribonuclease III [Chloroflexi bacterium]|nr:ribonuclease III [Chloroflexota bacterium]
MTLPADEVALLAAAEQRLGVRFADPAQLLEALTHRSFLNEQTGTPTPSNERLEFLGDSALGYLAARFVFERHPNLTEGELTGRRAALIRASTLARWARALDLASLVRLGQGEVTAGTVRDNLLADTFEAVLAAIVLDQGLAAGERFLRPLLERDADRASSAEARLNPKGRLQEVVQEREHRTPVYRTVGVEGPDHESVFTVEVVVADHVLGRGAGRSKQAAQQAAARDALARYSTAAATEDDE